MNHRQAWHRASPLEHVQVPQRCTDAGLLAGDPVDIAHVLLALAQGLAVQEGARWLGKSKASVIRRWEVGVSGILRGFAR